MSHTSLSLSYLLRQVSRYAEIHTGHRAGIVPTSYLTIIMSSQSLRNEVNGHPLSDEESTNTVPFPTPETENPPTCTGIPGAWAPSQSLCTAVHTCRTLRRFRELLLQSYELRQALGSPRISILTCSRPNLRRDTDDTPSEL